MEEEMRDGRRLDRSLKIAETLLSAIYDTRIVPILVLAR
ncbi:hypothetical protein SAMN06297251_114103 [Fulvimarina manganoxydans]|uniref:Uncharacterized protein n=1 Tax=Fulvimarina manganoxydans TaxID=937218 RepID=A0A1W2DGE7_9HYPH|nr:hypothetical protein SAMN06297251_114103 [Fulvimarina manganoxydans]